METSCCSKKSAATETDACGRMEKHLTKMLCFFHEKDVSLCGPWLAHGLLTLINFTEHSCIYVIGSRSDL